MVEPLDRHQHRGERLRESAPSLQDPGPEAEIAGERPGAAHPQLAMSGRDVALAFLRHQSSRSMRLIRSSCSPGAAAGVRTEAMGSSIVHAFRPAPPSDPIAAHVAADDGSGRSRRVRDGCIIAGTTIPGAGDRPRTGTA